MRRREVIAGLAAAGWPLGTRAQQPGKSARIGYLLATARADRLAQKNLDAFRQELRELGYIEGQNLVIEQRFAERDSELGHGLERRAGKRLERLHHLAVPRRTPLPFARRAGALRLPRAQKARPGAGSTVQSHQAPDRRHRNGVGPRPGASPRTLGDRGQTER